MRWLFFVLAFGALLWGRPLAAQLWDAPSFLPPRPTDDLGAYLFKPTGGDWAIAGIWRQSGDPNLGVRAGIASRDDPDDRGETEHSVILGAETYGPLLTADAASQVDASWTLGAGAALGGGTFLRIPVGISAGLRLGAGETIVVPYVHPRLGLEVFADDDTTDTDFAWAADLGADVLIGSSLVLRVGGSLRDAFGGDDDAESAVGVGIAWRMARGVTVR